MKLVLIVAAAVALAAPAVAEPIYKCVGATGKVEYANEPCKGKRTELNKANSAGAVNTVRMDKPATKTLAQGESASQRGPYSPPGTDGTVQKIHSPVGVPSELK